VPYLAVRSIRAPARRSRRMAIPVPVTNRAYDDDPSPRDCGESRITLQTRAPVPGPAVATTRLRTHQKESSGMSTNYSDGPGRRAMLSSDGPLGEELTSALTRERDQDVKLIITGISRLVDRRTSPARQAQAFNDVLTSISTLAFRDELTGLHNRRGFMRLGSQILALSARNRRRSILCYADVDQLKRVNDSAGHREGDDLLVRASEVLKATFRDTDLLGRLSGDEFAALTVSDGDAGERSILERLRRTLARTSNLQRRFPVSLSIGFAIFNPIAPASLEELVSQADGSMYVQKRARAAVPALFEIDGRDAGHGVLNNAALPPSPRPAKWKRPRRR